MTKLTRREFVTALLGAGVSAAVIDGRALAGAVSAESSVVPLEDVGSVTGFSHGRINFSRFVNAKLAQEVDFKEMIESRKPYAFRVDLANGDTMFFRGFVTSVDHEWGPSSVALGDVDTVVENIEIDLTDEVNENGVSKNDEQVIPIGAIPDKIDASIVTTRHDRDTQFSFAVSNSPLSEFKDFADVRRELGCEWTELSDLQELP